MRIAIIASGSRGDVEPYVALGKGLQAAGHVVRLVTHQDFESLVTSHGVEFWPVEGSVQDVAESMAALIENGNFLAILAQMGKEAQRGALALTSASLAACQGMELVVAGIGGVFVGVAIAEKLGHAAAAGVLHPLHAHARLSGLRRPQAAVVPRHAAQPPVVPGRPADDVAGVPVGRQAGAAGGVGSARGAVLRPLQLRMRARPADPLRLQPGRHPAARGLGRRHPRDRLLVPGSGRGLDAGPGPGGLPGSPAPRRSMSASGA